MTIKLNFSGNKSKFENVLHPDRILLATYGTADCNTVVDRFYYRGWRSTIFHQRFYTVVKAWPRTEVTLLGIFWHLKKGQKISRIIVKS